MNAPFTGSSPNPLKILLADDSANIHRAVALALRKTQFELIYCDNGQDAWRIIQEHMPAVVLADLDMPGPNGKELCLKVKGSSALSGVKVILLCGSFDQIEDQKLDALAADGRLWKPFEAHVLLSLLSTVLKAPIQRPAERTLFESQSPTLQSPMPTAPTPTPPPPPPPPRAMPPVTHAAIHESSEKTMPLSPFESNDPIRELTNEMTRETFSTQIPDELTPSNLDTWRPEEIHEPQVTQTLEQTESLPRDISPFERTLPPEEAVAPSQSSLTNDDLWTPNSDVPEQFGRDEKSIASDLGHFRDSSFNLAPKNIEIPSDADTPTISIDRSEFMAPKAPPVVPPAPKASVTASIPNPVAIDPEMIRKLIQEEIGKAFDHWFKEKLEKKLKDVMAEIEND